MDENTKIASLNQIEGQRNPEVSQTVQSEQDVAVVNEAQANTSESEGVVAVTPDQIRENLGVEKKQEPSVSYLDEVSAMVSKKTETLNEQAVGILEEKAIEAEMNVNASEETTSGPSLFGNEEDADDMDDFGDGSITVVPSQDDLVSIADELEAEEDDDMDEEEDAEVIRKIIASKVKEKFKPVTKKVDLNTIVIENEPTKLYRVFEGGATADENVIDWYLPTTDVLISMKEFKAVDITNLDVANSNRTQLNAYRDVYRLIYDHIVNENKPGFEEFLKIIRFEDIPHLYFSILKSSFEGEMTVPYRCTNEKCKEIFVIDDVGIDNLIKFDSEEEEKEYKTARENANPVFNKHCTENIRVQVSDTLVFDIRHPSVFNIIFESLSLEEEFRNRHSDIITLISYIDNIYFIDHEKGSMSPVGVKVFKDDFTKTVKNRIIRYSKILNTLSSDQYTLFTSTVQKVSDTQGISFVNPKVECPKCGHTIEEQATTPDAMLFQRHQLGTMASF